MICFLFDSRLLTPSHTHTHKGVWDLFFFLGGAHIFGPFFQNYYIGIPPPPPPPRLIWICTHVCFHKVGFIPSLCYIGQILPQSSTSFSTWTHTHTHTPAHTHARTHERTHTHIHTYTHTHTHTHLHFIQTPWCGQNTWTIISIIEISHRNYHTEYAFRTVMTQILNIHLSNLLIFSKINTFWIYPT